MQTILFIFILSFTFVFVFIFVLVFILFCLFYFILFHFITHCKTEKQQDAALGRCMQPGIYQVQCMLAVPAGCLISASISCGCIVAVKLTRHDKLLFRLGQRTVHLPTSSKTNPLSHCSASINSAMLFAGL